MKLLSALVPNLYVQIAPAHVEIRSDKSAHIWHDEALMALSPGPKNRVLAIGAAARIAVAQTPGAQLVQPFAHPRCLVSDYLLAEVFLKTAIRSLWPNRWLFAAPRVVIHPRPSAEQSVGGLTFAENETLRALAGC